MNMNFNMNIDMNVNINMKWNLYTIYVCLYVHITYLNLNETTNYLLASSFFARFSTKKKPTGSLPRIHPRAGPGTASRPCGASEPEFLESTGQSLVQTQRRGRQDQNP